MASADLLRRIETAQKDFAVVQSSPNFVRIKNNGALMSPFSEAQDLAKKWLERAKPVQELLDDSTLQSLVIFAERVVGVVDGREVRQNEAIPDALRRITFDFTPTLPLLIYELLEAAGIAGLSNEDFPRKRAAASQILGRE